MIDIRLIPQQLDDGCLVLRLGRGFRVIFTIMAAVILAGTLGSGPPAPLPLGLVLLLLAGALYEERWTVDPQAGTLTARHGLLPLARTRNWPIADIVSVRHSGAASATASGDRPGAGRRYLRYALVLRGGEALRVEVRRLREAEDPLLLPRTLATALQVPLEEQR